MDLSEFTFIDRSKSTYTDGYWLWNSKVCNVLGDFGLQIFDESDNPKPLKPEELQQAKEFVDYVGRNGEYLREIVFASYSTMRASDPEWLDLNKVPKDLIPENIGCYARMGILLTRGNPSEGRISVTPFWDEEYGLRMKLEGGDIISINSMRFEIRGGFLDYIS